jgi:hypothetical protein
MNIGITWARGKGSTLPGKNKYPILGKPLIYYPLMSLKKSGVIDYFYVFTEDDEIAEITTSIGWRVIPRPHYLVSYTDKGFDFQKAWRLITEYIANELDLPIKESGGDWVTSFELLSEYALHLNCNNCMLRSITFKNMLNDAKKNQWYHVSPAVRVDGPFMIARADKSLFPLWLCEGLNRQYYPPLYKVLLNTSVVNPRFGVTGRPRFYLYEIDDVEAIDVHDKKDVELIEYFLEKNPDYFGF